jgi:hypothetical protein
MNQIPDSPGLGFIEVDSSTDVRVTSKLKAVSKNAAWLVHNNTMAAVKVTVANFRKGATRYADALDAVTPQPMDIKPGGRAFIGGRFDLDTGIYDYDVLVNDVVAKDPQLEI